MSINWRIGKQSGVYPYSAILLSREEEWSTITCYDTDESRKHGAKWNKPVTEGHIVYDAIYMKCLEQVKS